MILKKLKLTNFRQFKGEQELSFSQEEDRNVTVIHAENGFGKTALLNALHWGFWGKLTGDMPLPENLITECVVSAAGNEETQAIVQIEYVHNNEDFFLRRSITSSQCRHNYKDSKLELNKVERGVVQKVNNPESSIGDQIPEAMGEFFFFNGENLNQLANEGKSQKIKEAIYNVLGLELLESAIEKAKAARKSLNTEFNSHADTNTQKMLDQLAKLDEEMDQLKKESKQLLENRDALEAENLNIENKLEATRESRAAQEKRKDLKSHLESTNQSLSRQEDSLIKLISEKSYYLFSSKLIERGEEIVKRLEEEGKIPAKFTTSVLEKLLEMKKCICDSDLTEGTPHHDAIKRLIEQATDRSLDDATQAVKTALTTIQGNYEGLTKEFSEVKKTKDDLMRKSQELADEIKQISRKIGASENLEVQDLEQTRVENAQRIQECIVEVSSRASDISEKQEYAEAMRQRVTQAKQSNEKARILQKQIKLSDDAIVVMQKMLEAEREDLRKELNSEIKSHFEQMIIKNYEAELSEEFKLRIMKESASGKMMEVGRSTGEKQITSLVFIASLIALARRRKDIPTILEGLWGGDLPMVMDSPYGQLGGYYRGEITKWLPTVAPQVAIFVSDSQWRGDVEKALDGRIGSEYILEYHAKSINAQASEEAEIRGISYPQFFEDQEEFTLIKKI